MATQLRAAFTVAATDRSENARIALLARRFDQAPVLDEGRLVGWVSTAHLGGRGPVASSLVTLDRCVVLARTSPVSDAISLVPSRGLLFLAGSDGIAEFIVPSDLDRHVVRSLLYILLSEIEFRLADLLREHVEEADIVLHFGRRERQMYDAARQKGRETHAVEYLYLRNYAPLSKLVPALRSDDDWSIDRQEADLLGLNTLRNCVAHPSKSLTGTLAPEAIAAGAALAAAVAGHLRRITNA